METAIIKMLITKYRKDKTLESWKVLENLIEDKSYCRDCNESIFYQNSLIRLGKAIVGITAHMDDPRYINRYYKDLLFVLDKEPDNLLALHYLAIYYEQSGLIGKI